MNPHSLRLCVVGRKRNPELFENMRCIYNVTHNLCFHYFNPFAPNNVVSAISKRIDLNLNQHPFINKPIVHDNHRRSSPNAIPILFSQYIAKSFTNHPAILPACHKHPDPHNALRPLATESLSSIDTFL